MDWGPGATFPGPQSIGYQPFNNSFNNDNESSYIHQLVSASNFNAGERFRVLDHSVKGLDKIYTCKLCFPAVEKVIKPKDNINAFTCFETMPQD